ncbi:hypothetical protein BDBG_03740 [Blastomyces gilchristii SLH14081]|uniref:Uncharacterized protein n=1 Tax=Blastomyces gilchristii (strain SLH14081) TaxID=559298 RepID=A0A179UMR5_BLAGS|nr:uncharacterized protein BDBG_03740 [Blastomyces gilchristii SLH14081]OAT07702.1 hypothetical protein BDBG_03740 [Blastomyces gilchristii SLH14081]
MDLMEQPRGPVKPGLSRDGEARMCRLCHKYCQECQSVYAFKAISVMGEKEIYMVSTFSDEDLKMSELHPFGV